MSEQNTAKEKAEEKQAKKPQDKKPLSGTDNDPSVWEKTAAAIAGDNKTLAGILRVVLNPMVMITAIIVGFFWFKNNKQKKQQQHEEELKKLQEQVSELEGEYYTQKKKRKKLKKLLLEKEEQEELQGTETSADRKPLHTGQIKRLYKTAYLD